MFCYSSVENETASLKIEQTVNAVPLSTQVVREQGTDRSSEASPDDQLNGGGEKVNHHRDPLHWFGVFVPPALRASQNSFKTAAIENIPSLVNSMKEMRLLEIEIRRARKKLSKAG